MVLGVYCSSKRAHTSNTEPTILLFVLGNPTQPATVQIGKKKRKKDGGGHDAMLAGLLVLSDTHTLYNDAIPMHVCTRRFPFFKKTKQTNEEIETEVKDRLGGR